MHGIRLSVEGATPRSLEYAYHSREISSAVAVAVSVRIPQINTEIRLEALGSPAACGRAVEGYLFSPYYTLILEKKMASGEETRTCPLIDETR